jgi:hypothetical protein
MAMAAESKFELPSAMPNPVVNRSSIGRFPDVNQEEEQQQQQQGFTLEIPFALLEALVKTNPSDEQRQQVLSSTPTAPTGIQPGLFLQQSQYANMLLDRQIQILQQEQAKRMYHILSQQSDDSKPAALATTKEDQHLQQMQLMMQGSSHPSTKKGPNHHRASAA